VPETVALLRALGPAASLLAGGIDLVVQMRHGRAAPSDVVSLDSNGESS
jgi:CO/xanthine dehydrogenase FAD-binding subunit